MSPFLTDEVSPELSLSPSQGNTAPSEYDPSRPTKYLQYLDANNLYGWAMSQPLPTGGFHWVEFDESKDLKWIVNELSK